MPIVNKILVSEEEINEPKNMIFKWPQNMRVIDYIEKRVWQNLELNGDSIWVTDVSTSRSMTYSQMLSSIKSVAGSFWEKGLRPGDMVLIMTVNYMESPIAIFGVWKAGGIVGCLGLDLLKDTLEERIRKLNPKFVVTDEQHLGRIIEAIRDTNFIQEVFVIGKVNGFTSFSDLLLNSRTECPDTVKFDSTCSLRILYSSGTTGVHKGVIHTHQSFGRILLTFTSGKPCTKGQKFVNINLAIFSSGMRNILVSTLQHEHIHFLSNFNRENLMEAIDRVKPSVVSLYAYYIPWICRHPELYKYDVSSIVSILTVGSPVHPTYERQIFDKLPNLQFLNILYGLTETGIVCSNQPKPEELVKIDKSRAVARHIIGSCGKILPYCKLKIIKIETGDKLGPGEEGEICVQTPFMMKEYLDMPHETAHLVREGWCYTGDKGYYDTEENVFVIGRYKELLFYKDDRVLPTDIEKEIITHPAVEDVAVVGLPHEFYGELPMAFVVLRPGTSVTDRELINFTNEKVIDEEKLRGGVRFIDRIPRNSQGKIVRQELKKLLC